ncbi:MAG: hypothetical protein Kow0029_02960 [Candidatus Rifleibacteriota bacterium]
MLSDLISNQAFTAMLNHFLSINESKRVLPFVYASGSLGYILSGLLLKFVVDLAGFQGLLILNGIIAIVAYTVLNMLTPFECERKARFSGEEDNVKKYGAEKVESSIEHPLARLLIISSFLIIFNRYLIDFLFAGAVSSYFDSGKALASFMGIFGAGADLIVIGLQTFVMKAVFSSIPVGRVMTFVPAILTFLCLSASFSQEFAIITTIQFLVMINSKNFSVPATTMLMGAIPQKKRVVYRRDMSIACSIASTCAGGFLLLARRDASMSTMFFIASLLYLTLSIVHFLIDKAYLKTLRSYIVPQSPEADADEEQISSLRFLHLEDRAERILILLKNENPYKRLTILKEVAELPSSEVEKIMRVFLAEENDARCLSEGARIMIRKCGNKALEHIEELIDTTSDQRLRADLIESLGKVRGVEKIERILSSHLRHFHHRVRAAAIISTIRALKGREMLHSALKELAAMTRSCEELMRASAAAVMGELGLPLFLPCLENLAMESNSAVSLSALDAISKIQTPAAVSCLNRLGEHPLKEVSQRAKKLANAAAKSSLRQINRLLLSISSEERLRLASKIKKIRSDENFELLAMILCIDEGEVRKRLIKVLEKSDELTLGILSRCLVRIGENQVSLNLAPPFATALNDFCSDLPVYAELISAIGAKTLEECDKHRDYWDVALHFLESIWAEKIIASNMILDSDHKELLGRRFLIACKLIMCLSEDPVTLIRSLEAARAGSQYSKAMAEEYIETRLGKKVSELVFPLIENHREKTSDELKHLAKKAELKLTESTFAAAELRLKANLKKFHGRT